MLQLKKISQPNKLHHFNIIEKGSKAEIIQFCQNNLNFNCHSNPNFFYRKYETIKAHDAHEISNIQSIKHSDSEKKVFIIECDSINQHAQNALLKSFETPTDGTFIFLLISESSSLLPTFLSRSEVFSGELFAEEKKEQNEVFHEASLKEIQKMSILDKAKLIEKILNGLKKERLTKKQIKTFLNNILIEFKNNEARLLQKNRKIKAFNSVLSHIDFNGSNVKSILEFVIYCI